MRVIYLVVLALSATCLSYALACVICAGISLWRIYTSNGVELFSTYAVALVVPMTLVGLMLAASIAIGIWAFGKLFKRSATIDFL
jgi:hypothetical protein|uniref:Uncharacterized protein n=1 Tax=Myoviridae sp. ctshb19 TaxID=2825194 RepID=A0A8S5UGN8_9CAUD|nr:MAG TPA: hypothetical protein [Myoviridae sp. ctshb19]